MSLHPPKPPRWPVPEGVATAVTLAELELLQDFAYRSEDGRALEVGTHLGFSCIGMAMVNAWVVSIDPHVDGPAGSSTWLPFLANLRRHRIGGSWWTKPGFGTAILDDEPADWGPVDAWRMTFQGAHGLPHWSGQAGPLWSWDVGPQGEGPVVMVPKRFGFVFIDGDHLAPSPSRDLELARHHLREGGFIAVHDVTPRWPGVWQAVRDHEKADHLEEVAAQGVLRIYRAEPAYVPRQPE